MEPQQYAPRLSQNGIIEISSGFDGPYTLQVIACRITPAKQYHLCLSDGKLYIGGKYQSSKNIDISLYNVVRIQCKFLSRFSPIQILSLQILNAQVTHLLGSAPFTLHDYFTQQKQNNTSRSGSEKDQDVNEHMQQINQMGSPKKKMKINFNHENRCQNQQDPHTIFPESRTQKIPLNAIKIDQIQNAETQSLNLKSVSQISSISTQRIQKKSIQQRQDKTTNPQKMLENKMAQQRSDLNLASSLMKPKVQIVIEQQIFNPKTQIKKYETHNTFVSELYERMLRWKILCRIASIRKFISAKGTKCASMYLIDQKGDQIKAMYYENSKESYIVDSLEQGKVYSFSGGEIKQTTTPDEKQSLQITLNSNSDIQQRQQIFIYPYSSKKLTKFKDLIQTTQQVNLIGMIKSWQMLGPNPTQYKSKPRIKGVICNPLQLYEIEFSKPFYQGQSQPTTSNVYVLVNFAVAQTQNAIRLLGSSQSYFVKIQPEDINYKAKTMLQYIQLGKLKQDMGEDNQKWRKYAYINLSQIKYSKRTVHQMRKISNQQQSIIYSEILVSVVDIKLKKQYMACPVCKKSTIQQEYVLYQCLKCKKIVDPTPAIIINLTLADATGSFQVDVIGEKVKIFLDVDVSEFSGLSQEQKECNLQIAKFSQFVVKIKTQRKSAKQIIYNLQDASKQEHNFTMKQIRRRTVEQKLKLQQKWESFE